MTSNPGPSSGAAAKRSIPEDFKGDKDDLVPFDKVDALLTQKGSVLETEVRFINGRLTTVWKQLPSSVRDLWMFAATVSPPPSLPPVTAMAKLMVVLT